MLSFANEIELITLSHLIAISNALITPVGKLPLKCYHKSALVLPNVDISENEALFNIDVSKNDTHFKAILCDAFFRRLLKHKSLIFALKRSLTISLHNIISI